jgi:ribosomal subunit interface protein
MTIFQVGQEEVTTRNPTLCRRVSGCTGKPPASVHKGRSVLVGRMRPGTEFCVDIVVKGRKTEVPDRFRKHVAEKLEKVQKLDGKVINLDVEVSKEHNPRQASRCDRVEITLRTRGPVIRAEASASDPYAALDMATGKLEARLRKQHDKRRVHRGGSRTPISVAAATAHLAAELNGAMDAAQVAAPRDGSGNGTAGTRKAGPLEVQGDGPLVVREKTHTAAPMTLDQALYEMELVGHDFYLFVDAETKQPSVVYRRHAYDYGVIHLEQDPFAESAPPGAGGALGG